MGLEGDFPFFFWQSEKVSWFSKIGLNCVHLWVESSIQNLVLRVSRKKSFKMFPCKSFSLVFLKKSLSKCPNFTKRPLLWKITAWTPEDLNISQFHVHICRSSRSKMFVKLGALKSFTVFWIKKRLQRRCFLFPCEYCKFLKEQLFIEYHRNHLFCIFF